jgi:hypothetical protein
LLLTGADGTYGSLVDVVIATPGRLVEHINTTKGYVIFCIHSIKNYLLEPLLPTNYLLGLLILTNEATHATWVIQPVNFFFFNVWSKGID